MHQINIKCAEYTKRKRQLISDAGYFIVLDNLNIPSFFSVNYQTKLAFEQRKTVYHARLECNGFFLEYIPLG